MIPNLTAIRPVSPAHDIDDSEAVPLPSRCENVHQQSGAADFAENNVSFLIVRKSGRFPCLKLPKQGCGRQEHDRQEPWKVHARKNPNLVLRTQALVSRGSDRGSISLFEWPEWSPSKSNAGRPTRQSGIKLRALQTLPRGSIAPSNIEAPTWTARS